ncbi:uncharacterized protein [Branchiostoma lanceolatum]|uniref:uncharacterized protein n=1 Tax=Branchiostoma lanceolatum TaxID=7740 RepID=UPI0034521B84
MALGRSWMLALGILWVVGGRDVSGAAIKSCIPPYVLADRHTLEPYNPDVSADYVCPANYRQFGDDCFQPVEYGQHYGPIVHVPFIAAQQTCREREANVTSLLDLQDPDVLQAVVKIRSEYNALRDLLMFELNSCVELSSSAVWGEQLCVKPCSELMNKMVICRRPAEPVQK